MLPKGFVYADQMMPTLIHSDAYFSTQNFIGQPFPKYENKRIIMTLEAAHALEKAVAMAAQDGLDLLIYDAYRPQTTVDYFDAWAHDVADQRQKADYYPRVDKAQAHALGYIARRSTHSRGSTVDLTLIKKGQQPLNPVRRETRTLADGFMVTYLDDGSLDMGTHFDLFDEASWPGAHLVSDAARANRLYLQELMVMAGFSPYSKEWWHFQLHNEPFPETYFDFAIA